MITSQDYFEELRQREAEDQHRQEYYQQMERSYYREMERQYYRDMEERWQLWDYHKALETLNNRKDVTHLQSLA